MVVHPWFIPAVSRNSAHRGNKEFYAQIFHTQFSRLSPPMDGLPSTKRLFRTGGVAGDGHGATGDGPTVVRG
ncbi:MAG: hypothetical protein AAF821_09815 [Cyanobacteria bacterium P01_D01_bin.156]